MKQSIDGKMFNTETAKKLADYWNGLSSSDFGNVTEYLYLSRKGAAFIAGYGGAMTGYAESVGNMFCGGERIRPLLTPGEIIEWCERTGNSQALEEHFPELIEEA
jgi:hypothetical protein